MTISRFIQFIVSIAIGIILCFVYDKWKDKKKQKPTDIKEHPYEGFIGYCPKCKRVVRFAQKYCHNCKKPLDWSDVVDMPKYHNDDQKVKGIE